MNPENLIDLALSKLGISKEELESFSKYYNGDYAAYGNEVYQDIKVRLVHLENFIKGNWWDNRFYFLWRDFSNYDQIIDIGFSVPYLPIHLSKTHELSKLPKLLLVDENETSKKLAEIVLEPLDVQAAFVVGKAEDRETWKEIKELVLPGKKLFSAFETIEHFDRPELFWTEISHFKGDHLTLSLPIGEKIPSHHSVFKIEEEVTNYLTNYLDLKEVKVFNSKESDYKIYTALGVIK